MEHARAEVNRLKEENKKREELRNLQDKNKKEEEVDLKRPVSDSLSASCWLCQLAHGLSAVSMSASHRLCPSHHYLIVLLPLAYLNAYLVY